MSVCVCVCERERVDDLSACACVFEREERARERISEGEYVSE